MRVCAQGEPGRDGAGLPGPPGPPGPPGEIIYRSSGNVGGLVSPAAPPFHNRCESLTEVSAVCAGRRGCGWSRRSGLCFTLDSLTIYGLPDH